MADVNAEEYVLPAEYEPYFADGVLACRSCGNELEFDTSEFVFYCVNEWEHG